MAKKVTFKVAPLILLAALLGSGCMVKKGAQCGESTIEACAPSAPDVEPKDIDDRPLSRSLYQDMSPVEEARARLLAERKKREARRVADEKAQNDQNEALKLKKQEVKIYTVQLGAFSDISNLVNIRRVIPDNYITYAYKLNTLSAISVGHFTSFQDAETVADIMRSAGYMDAYPRELPQGAKQL